MLSVLLLIICWTLTTDATGGGTGNPSPTPPPTEPYSDSISFGKNVNSHSSTVIAAFNSAFQSSYSHIIKRECPSCNSAWQEVYYKRHFDSTPLPADFNAYSYMRSWRLDDDNTFNDDFTLWSSLEAAFLLDDGYQWTSCKYSSTTSKNEGAFAGCGPNGNSINNLGTISDTNYCFISQESINGNTGTIIDSCQGSVYDREVTFSVYMGPNPGLAPGLPDKLSEKWGYPGTRDFNIGYGFLVGICIVTFILIVIVECICGCCECLYKKVNGQSVKYKTVKIEDISDSEYDTEEMKELKN